MTTKFGVREDPTLKHLMSLASLGDSFAIATMIDLLSEHNPDESLVQNLFKRLLEKVSRGDTKAIFAILEIMKLKFEEMIQQDPIATLQHLRELEFGIVSFIRNDQTIPPLQKLIAIQRIREKLTEIKKSIPEHLVRTNHLRIVRTNHATEAFTMLERLWEQTLPITMTIAREVAKI